MANLLCNGKIRKAKVILFLTKLSNFVILLRAIILKEFWKYILIYAREFLMQPGMAGIMR